MINPVYNEIEPRRLWRGLAVSVLASTLGCVWVAIALGMSTTMLMLHLGASGFQIGLVVTTQQVAVLAQLPAAFLVTKIKRRRPFWGWLALIHRILWITPALVLLTGRLNDGQRIWIILAAISISALFSQSASIAWFSWMADMVPEKVSGRFWGIRQTVVMSSILFTAVWAGRLLDNFSLEGPAAASRGFVSLFVIATLLGLADILLHWTVPEPEPVQAPRGSALAALRTLWQEHDFRFLTLAMGTWMFTVGLVGSFGPVFLREYHHATYTQLGITAMAGSLGALVAGIPIGRMVDRIGARSVGVVMIAIAPVLGMLSWFMLRPGDVTLFSFTVPQFMAWMAPAHFVGGALFSGVGLCQMQLANVVAPRRGRTVALALHWTVVGIMSACGPIAGGVMMDMLKTRLPEVMLPHGVPLAWFHVLLLIQTVIALVVAMPLLHKVHERGAGLPRGFVMALLRIGNPVRLITSVYNVYVVKTPK